MKIGKYTLRKPWTYEVEIDLGAEIYEAVRKSIGEDIAKEIEEAAVHIPHEWASQPTPSGIPLAYSKGVLAGRQQALNIIRNQHGN